MNAPSQSSKSLLEEAQGWEIVAFAGVLTYISTIAFEYGVALYWGFSRQLVSFTLENAFGVFLPIVLFGCFLLLMIGPVREISTVPKPYRTAQWILGGILILSLPAVFAFEVYRLSKSLDKSAPMLLGISSVLAFICCGMLVVPKTNTYRIPRPLLLYGVLICIVPWSALVAGYHLQETTTQFLVIERSPKLIVLRCYGTTCVCAEFENKERLAEGFRMVDIKDSPERLVRTKFSRLLPFGLNKPKE